jgi:putative transposase
MGQRRRRRHTPEQILRKLREADRLQDEGRDVASVAKELEVSEQTLHRWRAQDGELKASAVKRLRELERENGKLKRMVADQLLEIDALKEIAKGNVGTPVAQMRGGAQACRSGSRSLRGERADRRPAPLDAAAPPEFRREAVRLLETSGRSTPKVVAELGVSDESLRYRQKSVPRFLTGTSSATGSAGALSSQGL